jgi:hypothetical protein
MEFPENDNDADKSEKRKRKPLQNGIKSRANPI